MGRGCLGAWAPSGPPQPLQGEPQELLSLNWGRNLPQAVPREGKGFVLTLVGKGPLLLRRKCSVVLELVWKHRLLWVGRDL